MIPTSVQGVLSEKALINPSLLDGAGLRALVSERLPHFGGNEAAYAAELARSSDEIDRLVSGIAVPETWLFRYPHSFEYLLEFLMRRRAEIGSSLRMLSIGCATGQEAYCMAITAIQAGWTADQIRIDAVDRNQELLNAATLGLYRSSSIRTEVPKWGVGYLRRQGDHVEIDPAIRKLVRFSRADVTDPASIAGRGPYDVIFCRNLLIYLNAAGRDQLLGSICAELIPGGLLFLGHAEQVLGNGFPLRNRMAYHAFALERITADFVPSRTTSSQPAPQRAIPQTRAPASPTPVVRPNSAAAVKPPASPVTPTVPRITSPTIGVSSTAPQTLEDARDLADSGNSEASEKLVQSIIAREGPTAASLELLGLIRMSVNDAVAARKHFEQAVYLDPNRPTALLQLALIFERSGDAQRAGILWDRARRASAGSAVKDRT